jgi:D-inositol-3-phosphate glycosyltransferase
VCLAAARSRLGLQADGPVITFVGRIQPLKAPDVMLRAIAVLLERRPDLRSSLTVAVVGGPSGSGLERPDSLVRLAEELGIDSIVRFVPPVAQHELVDWYAASSLVCVPSYNESFGLVAIEAQATGTPVVAAAVGGLTTAVHDERSGLLVADHEPASYAAAFERVLFEPDLRQRLAVGAEVHAQQFGWDRTAEMMLGVYTTAQQKMRADLSGIAL